MIRLALLGALAAALALQIVVVANAGLFWGQALARVVPGVLAALVIVALVTSAVTAFFYVRIVVLMYFAPPPDNAPDIAVPSPLTTIALTVGAVVTLLLGVVPQPLIDIATRAANLRG